MDYNEKFKLLEALDEWSNFIHELEGSEYGDFINSLNNTISAAGSAADDEAETILINLLLKELNEDIADTYGDDWLQDRIYQNDRNIQQSLTKFKPEWIEANPIKTVAEQYKELLTNYPLPESYDG